MGIATHLGVWLLGNTKGGAGEDRGAADVTQTKDILFNDAPVTQAFILPAGAQILSASVYQSANFTSGGAGAITIIVNGTPAGTVAVAGAGTQGILAITPQSNAQAQIWKNVGSAPAVITYTSSVMTAGAGMLSMTYVVKKADGSYLPTSSEV